MVIFVIFYSILFYSILFYSILFYFILFYSIFSTYWRSHKSTIPGTLGTVCMRESARDYSPRTHALEHIHLNISTSTIAPKYIHLNTCTFRCDGKIDGSTYSPKGEIFIDKWGSLRCQKYSDKSVLSPLSSVLNPHLLIPHKFVSSGTPATWRRFACEPPGTLRM